MAERKTVVTKVKVSDFVAGVKNERRRKDAKAVMKIMRDVSGKRAQMWGPSIIGYGVSKYKLASGKEEEICQIGFSPRASSLVFYLGKFKERAALLKKLGKHKVSGGGCLYINKLEDVDMNVFEKMIESAWKA